MKSPLFLQKKARIAIIVAVLVLPFVFFSSSLRPWSGRSIGPNILQEIFFPIQLLWVRSTNFVRDSWTNYVALTQAAKENKQLKQDLAVMQVKILDYENVVAEVNRLRGLLDFAKRYERQIVVAEVVGTLGQAPLQSLRIASGRQDGLRVGMPVVASSGLVGIIIRAGFLFADVQLLGDGNLNVDVIVERTRTRGVLQGIAPGRSWLQIHRREDIRIGDTLVTSGLVGSIPKGLPVGRVVKIRYEADHVTQMISVQPWVDYLRLEEVLVLDRENGTLDMVEDIAGADWLGRTTLQNQGAKPKAPSFLSD